MSVFVKNYIADKPFLLFYSLALFLIFSHCQNNPELMSGESDKTIYLEGTARKQVEREGEWQSASVALKWNAAESAIIICDMWDRHWCDSATARVSAMAPEINAFINKARDKGVTIVHAPSSTIEFYESHPARKRVLATKEVKAPIPLSYWFDPDTTREAALPIDDSDEGCDSKGNEPHSAWSRQIAAIEIDKEDIISDSGQEIYNYFEAHHINNVVLCGVHTNMCVLGRTFGIRGQVKLGRNVVLARDLTDAMYNPEMPPYVSHRAGTDLVVQHIEKYWAPSILSSDLIN